MPRRLLEEWLFEDVGRGDLTSTVLGLRSVKGVAELYVRESCIVACSEEAGEVYRIAGAENVEVLVESGSMVEPGTVVLRAEGRGDALHAAWRVAQVIVALCSGVATKTWRMVRKAREANPKIAIVTTRKAPPGLRPLYFKAVIAGGGMPHRAGLDDTVLLFDNHWVLLRGGFSEALERLRASNVGALRSWGVEVRSVEEALEAIAAGAQFIQFEKVKPDLLRQFVRVVREKAPHVKIGVAGGIDDHNVAEYAATGVDFIVTSAPYHASPVDVGTRMKRLE
ncbi:modD protein [Pyrolobus fumarii 1A]|uniref:Nicotinate-nucleotide pyrophosphorylase [carboxylating] n=1 Tax=Pyrolobus fumarii (strain DSM 11204 / 1A) TaxID=694429 RepID=G0EGC2_PYRF1|nr:ModD protein [Pyrolobus fumarii]AEM39147.1 modD protein [Pyrolobus fumarii 1A]